ncbi:MAG: hypothetical protein F6K10_35880 [Moorea sp. SIO2B7]|nr:hypothetical protein [Moorena sp. SIO2B7]
MSEESSPPSYPDTVEKKTEESSSSSSLDTVKKTTQTLSAFAQRIFSLCYQGS